MARLRCNTCLGEFDDVLPNGTLYFHACPPIVDARTGALSPRPNRRNENRARPTRRGDPAPLKREGLGVTLLAGTIGTPAPSPDDV